MTVESDWLETSKIPCVDITRSMFLRDSGMASYCVCVCLFVRVCEFVFVFVCVHEFVFVCVSKPYFYFTSYRKKNCSLCVCVQCSSNNLLTISIYYLARIVSWKNHANVLKSSILKKLARSHKIS